MKSFYALVFVFGLAAANGLYGQKVLRTAPLTKAQSEFMKAEMKADFDFWKEPTTNGRADFRVAPEILDDTINKLKSQGIETTVFIEDVGKAIDESQSEERKGQRIASAAPKAALNWDDYYPYDEIIRWIKEVATNNPDLGITEDYGSSYEGRTLTLLKLTERARVNAPIVWIEAGIHAREWIAPAVATYMINELVLNKDGYTAKYFDNLKIYFIPSANPDGYEYSRIPGNATRMWRKTRSQFAPVCVGADPNRNFGFHWDEGGAADVSCSSTYHGIAEWSEPEVAAIRDYHRDVFGQPPFFAQAIHSYGQTYLYPYCYKANVTQPNSDDVIDLATRTVAAIGAVHGMTYTVQSGYELYEHSGTGVDWYAAEGATYSYVSEVRDEGQYGFILPPDQIIPTGEEIWAGLQVMLDQVMADNP